MDAARWEERFRSVYAKAKKAYAEGADNPGACFGIEDRAFLAEIGCSAQEVFDLVEDDVTMGEPGLEKAVRITAVRRDYFLQVDDGKPPERMRHAAEFPSPAAVLGGIPWLPRILEKARAKLRGELPPDLMYSCGGDRRFLREHGLEPDAFLRAVWKAGDEDAAVLDYVRRRGPGAA